MWSLLVLSVLGAALAAQSNPTRLLTAADLPARAGAAATLQAAVDADAATATTLRAALAQVREQLPDSTARDRCAAAAADLADAAALRLLVVELVDDLTFTPVAEAALPAGVPGFVALDEIELRDYPAYRMVRTAMRGSGMTAFWPLFTHIQEKQIAMTTPVQFDYGEDADGARTMAFLYGSPDLGTLGKDGRVEVVDVPAVTVLTIGARGHERAGRVEELHTRLRSWLDAEPAWEAAGHLRTMVYNSPSVGGDRRYFEVQLPVRRKPAPAPAGLR